MEGLLTRPENIRVHVLKNQRRAMSVGVFYWFGIVLLFCFAIFPYVSELNGFNEMNGELWVLTFLTPLNSFLAGDMDALMPTVVGVL